MSTYYYDMQAPWGNAEVEDSSEHYRIILWDGPGSRAGTLTLRVEDGREAIFHFFRDVPAYQVHFGSQGATLRKLREARTSTLLSERGILTTVGELRRESYRCHDMALAPALDEPA